MHIYIIKNKVNNKHYVGKTSTGVNARCRRHVRNAYNPESSTYNTVFSQAIRKYGVENFELEKVCEYPNITEEELYEKEIEKIKEYNSCILFENGHGYNMTYGGDGVSQKLMPNLDVYNVITYELIEENISFENALLKYEVDRFNVFKALKLNQSTGGYKFLVHGTEKMEKKAPSILVYDANTREFLNSFYTVSDCSEYYNISRAYISNCLIHKIKNQTAKGYIIINFGEELPTDKQYTISVYDANTNVLLNSFYDALECSNFYNIDRSTIYKCLKGKVRSIRNFIIAKYSETNADSF